MGSFVAPMRLGAGATARAAHGSGVRPRRRAAPPRHGHTLTLQVDIFNFLNLLNKNWGLFKIPNTALLTQVAGPAAQQPTLRFDPAFLPYSSLLPDRTRRALQLL